MPYAADVTPPFYHGTRADLKPGDLLSPGFTSNYAERKLSWIYSSATLDAANRGCELAKGEGRERIYIVEPTGPFEEDPNLTDKKFPGNPTLSYRSREPLRVIGEVAHWQEHPPEQLQAMKDHLERLNEQGIEAIDQIAARIGRCEGRERIYAVEPAGAIAGQPYIPLLECRDVEVHTRRLGKSWENVDVLSFGGRYDLIRSKRLRRVRSLCAPRRHDRLMPGARPLRLRQSSWPSDVREMSRTGRGDKRSRGCHRRLQGRHVQP